MTSKSSRLKEYLTIIDTETFPENPAPIFLWKSRHDPKGTIARYWHREAFLLKNIREELKSILRIVILLFYYFLNSLEYIYMRVMQSNPQERRAAKHLALHTREVLIYQTKLLNRDHYHVITPCILTKPSDLDLCFVAFHEVRHRVQMFETFKEADKGVHVAMLRAYQERQDDLLKHFERRKTGYRGTSHARETDADFIANILTLNLAEEYGTIITPGQLRDFLKDWRQVMLWKNPDIKL